MTKLKQNLPKINKKDDESLTEPAENKEFAPNSYISTKSLHLAVENLRKKHNLTKKSFSILYNNLCLYYSRDEKKRNDTIVGVSIGKIAAMSGCSVRTVDKALKNDRFYQIKSGKRYRINNRITLKHEAFSLFQELSTILGDKSVDYFQTYYKKLRTYIPKGIIYNIYHKNFVLKNFKLEPEIEKTICNNLNIPQKTFRLWFNRFDFIKAGGKFGMTILELVINWIKSLIKRGLIITNDKKREYAMRQRMISNLDDITEFREDLKDKIGKKFLNFNSGFIKECLDKTKDHIKRCGLIYNKKTLQEKMCDMVLKWEKIEG